MLQAQQLRTSYPKTFAKFEEFAKVALMGIAEGFRENKDDEVYIPTKEHIANFADSCIHLNPRYLYDFFDNEGVHIGVIPENGFTSYNDVEKVSTPFPTRREAEESAYLKAFKQLENGSN